MRSDYQWPGLNYKKKFVKNLYDDSSLCQVEQYFEDLFGYTCFLLPSARSILSLILRYKKIDRSNFLFAPQYMSHCVWDTLSRYGNPVAIYSKECDVVLNVNKWGFPFKSNVSNSFVINDSVDSVFLNKKELLIDSDFEIISLPKVIGSISGGILVTKDEGVGEYIKDLRRVSDRNLSRSQHELKENIVSGKESLFSWESRDWNNFFLQEREIANISLCLEFYQKSIEIINKRVEFASRKMDLSYLNLSTNRLPCLLPVKSNSLTENNKLMKRKFNFSLNNLSNDFEDAFLLPVHIGISDEEFEALIKQFAVQPETT